MKLALIALLLAGSAQSDFRFVAPRAPNHAIFQPAYRAALEVYQRLALGDNYDAFRKPRNPVRAPVRFGVPFGAK